MGDFSPSTLRLSELARIVRRHFFKAGATFLLVSAASVGALIVWPRSFESEAKLFVRLGRESVTLDPTATTGQTISVSEPRENEINSILEVMRSRSMQELVVDRLSPAVVLGANPIQGAEPTTATMEAGLASAPLMALKDGLDSAIGTAKRVLEPTGEIDDREKAILELQRVYVDRPKKSNVIVVSYQAGTPELAQHVVQTFVEAYQEEHLRIHRTPRSYEFFKEQEELIKSELKRAADEIRTTKNEMKLASVEGRRLLLETHITETTSRLRVASADLEATQAQIESMQELIDSLPERINTEEVSGHNNVAADTMRDRLFALELHEKELLSKYREEHPLVVAVRQQVQDSRNIVSELPQERTQTTTRVNPVREAQSLKLADERAQLSSLLAEIAALDEQHKKQLDELQTLNAHEVRLAELQRSHDIAEANLRTYREKLEQARITQAMEEGHISNVTISQPATLSRRPASPKKRQALGGALALALLCSVGVIGLTEASDRRLRTVDQVERQLGLPVLIHIPHAIVAPRVRGSRLLIESH